MREDVSSFLRDESLAVSCRFEHEELGIVVEEADEAVFWLELLVDRDVQPATVAGITGRS